jgi:protein SCO1/2
MAVATALLTAAVAAGPRWNGDYFPNVPLITRNGSTVHFYDDLLRGKTVAIELIYTRCKDACPLETARLAQVGRLLGDRVGRDIFFYSISLDPEHDTPAVLKTYAEKFHAGPGWEFLTGKPADIEQISRKLGLYSEPNSGDRDGHTPTLLIGDEPSGQWMRTAALDNPRLLARMIGQWLSSWKHWTPERDYTEVRDVAYDPGATLFRRHCAACHTVGRGDSVGPDLAGVTTRRPRPWLERFIREPDTLLERGDPVATALYARYRQVAMPRQNLTAADVLSLIDFLDRAPPSVAAR